MHITKINQATPYIAPGHFDMCGLRLQGFDVSDSENFWVGLSQFLPGGGAESDISPLEKVYVVLEGEINIIQGKEETTLGPLDSCYIGPNLERSIINKTNKTVSMLVIMPYPEKK